MRVNEAGLDIVKHFESLALSPYVCPAGYPTIGYGATRGLDGLPVSMDHRDITEDEAEDLLQRDIRIAERDVMVLIKAPLEENQFSALASFAFNVGGGNLKASTLRAKLNRLDYLGAANELPKWRRGGGKILRGLVLRRAAEKSLFLL